MNKLTLIQKIIVSIFFWGMVLFSQSIFAQGVKIGDNPTKLELGALLELQSSKQGLIIPRMNTIEMNTINVRPGVSKPNGSNGLIIYNTDSLSLCYYNGFGWLSVSSLLENPQNTALIIKLLELLPTL
jgi:hypothetical protein